MVMKHLFALLLFLLSAFTANQSFAQCTGPIIGADGFFLFPAPLTDESSCIDGVATGGSITFTNPCPTGTMPEYTFGSSFATLGGFSSVPPVYSQTERVFFATRCACTSDPTTEIILSPIFATNPEICPTVSAPVPTMSQWGLIIFGLLVLNLSITLIYREDWNESVIE